jgi:hypothetical protein
MLLIKREKAALSFFTGKKTFQTTSQQLPTNNSTTHSGGKINTAAARLQALSPVKRAVVLTTTY